MDCTRSIRSFVTFAAMFCLALVAASRPAASAEEKLVAPAYPGAVRFSPAKLGGTEGVVFFARDPHEKVQAFYVPKYARLPKEDEGRVRGAGEIPLIAQSVGEVTSIITSMKGDYTQARASEIIVEWKPEIFAGTGIGGSFLIELQKQAKKHPGHDAELAALKARYGWLGMRTCFSRLRGSGLDADAQIAPSGQGRAIRAPLFGKRGQGRFPVTRRAARAARGRAR
jgi:hypothetical protein